MNQQQPNSASHMEQLTRQLLGQMQSELQTVASQTDNHLQQSEQSFYVVEAAIKGLKEFVTTNEFKTDEEEIRFFKEIKPMFLKELVYYTELYHIESNKPVGSIDAVKQYYAKVLESFAAFFDKNRLLYNYYRAGKSDMDNIYFLRRIVISPQQPIYTLDLDAQFCTPHSNTLGKILAFEELSNFLNQAIKESPQPKPAEGQPFKKSPWVWKVPDVNLYEVGLGIWKSGAVTHGPGGFRQFMIELCAFFNVKAGNPYRIVLGMSYRKKGRTPFLRDLVEVTERSFDEKDL
nr:RteC domain-containing protein [Pedobacter sp. ASV19]